MTDPQDSSSSETNLVKGLPMFAASDPAVLTQEKAKLAELQNKGLFKRWSGYFALTGPGWLQSALTLGGGSAMASLFAGAYLQYKLLWVQPIAMLIGVFMLAVVSRQTLCTGLRPFPVMKRILNPAVAWAWAFGALAVTVVWHFAQYALAAGMTEDMINACTGWQPTRAARTTLLIVTGLVFLVISTAVTWSYGRGHKGVKFYERMLKGFVWLIIITFTLVVTRQAFAGHIQFSKVAKGFLPLKMPTDPRGVSVVMAAFAAAVGINSTFLLPYSLLARGWAREHRGLSWFDLVTGTLLPFCIATSLVVIAAGATIYDPQTFASGSAALSPIKAAAMFESAGLNRFFARIIFGLGILGMTLSTITVHMLMSGFAVCEMFGVEPGGWRYRLGCLIPAPAATGVIFWKYMGPWVAVPASAICGLLLPFAYIIFFILNNSKKYLGPDKPTGIKAALWNIGMIIAIIVSVTSAGYYLYRQL
ncbi:MAG TPA: divalent metal cation transporter [Sedimentisphaerales bacterium]|nr:divalent metal cation transporter [Sedimentisphaerales bacterium]